MTLKRNFFQNPWVIRALSLLFAVLLFVMVKVENGPTSAVSQSASLDSSITLNDVQVELGKHDESIYVTGLPESVSVTLTGPKNILNQMQSMELTAITEDLTTKDSGRQTVKLYVKDLPNSVTAKTSPSNVVIDLSKKVSQTFEIEYDIAEDVIAEGHQLGNVTLNKKTVTLTGTSDLMEKVSRVYINIASSEPRRQSFTQTFPLQIVDSNGELLDISSDATEIEAQIEVLSNAKSVGINIVPTGENNQQFNYAYQLVNTTTASIAGDASILDPIQSVNLSVNVASLTTSSVVSGNLVLPNGITALTPTNINVQVTLTTITSQNQENTTVEEVSHQETTSTSTVTNQPQVEDTTESQPNNE